MSYTVTVLVPPVPSNDAEARDSVAALRKLQGPRPNVLQTLHDRLVARFPCIATLADDEVDDGVWSDGPLIDNFGHRTAVLGISRQVPEVLPFLVQTASDLGLVVVDPQTGTIHRRGSPRLASPDDARMTKSDVKRLLREGLDPTLKDLGFGWRRGHYVRAWSGGCDCLGWGIANYGDVYSIGAFVTVRIDAVEELVTPHVPLSKPDDAKQAWSINVCGFRAFEDGPETLRRTHQSITTKAELSAFAAALGELVRERVDPFWRSLRTPSDLWEMPAGWRRFWPQPVELREVALACLCASLPEQRRLEAKALAAFAPTHMYHQQIDSLITELRTRRGES